MSSALSSSAPIPTRSRWRDVVMPKEHGSWSLALEPVALGLLLAPSVAGFCIGTAALAGFLARRPLKLALKEHAGERRETALVALSALTLLAIAALAIAVGISERGWLVWLLPSALAGAVFLFFDLKNGGREEVAEIAGATAFAGITGVIVASAGWSPAAALGAMFVMCCRAVPTVIFVRTYVRSAKTGTHRPLVALIATGVVVVGAIMLATRGMIPAAAIAALTLLFFRAAAYLLYPRPRLRPRNLGFQELALGAAYVAAMAVAWRF